MLPGLDWLYDNENEHDDNGDYQMTTVRSSDRHRQHQKQKTTITLTAGFMIDSLMLKKVQPQPRRTLMP